MKRYVTAARSKFNPIDLTLDEHVEILNNAYDYLDSHRNDYGSDSLMGPVGSQACRFLAEMLPEINSEEVDGEPVSPDYRYDCAVETWDVIKRHYPKVYKDLVAHIADFK